MKTIFQLAVLLLVLTSCVHRKKTSSSTEIKTDSTQVKVIDSASLKKTEATNVETVRTSDGTTVQVDFDPNDFDTTTGPKRKDTSTTEPKTVTFDPVTGRVVVTGNPRRITITKKTESEKKDSSHTASSDSTHLRGSDSTNKKTDIDIDNSNKTTSRCGGGIGIVVLIILALAGFVLYRRFKSFGKTILP